MQLIFYQVERSENVQTKMVLSVVKRLMLLNPTSGTFINIVKRNRTHYRDGTLRPVPRVIPFGMIAVLGSVLPGLFIGAAISKNVANFLEENDLFVPSDDDDDED